MLASASNAIVLGFNVKAEPKAASQAQANGVDVRSYNVIYEAINDVKAALAGMLAPEIRETVAGPGARFSQIFVISKLGPICRLDGRWRARSYVTRRPGSARQARDERARPGDDQLAAAGSRTTSARCSPGSTAASAWRGVNGASSRATSSRSFTSEEVARTL